MTDVADLHAAVAAPIPPACPAWRDEAADRVVVSRAEDVAAVLADRSLSVDPANARPAALAGRGLRPEDLAAGATMAWTDGTAHDRLRRLTAEAFSARSVNAMRPRVEALAAALLDAVDPGAPFELVAALASPLPTLVISAMLGIDDADAARFKTWSDDLNLMLAPTKSADELARMGAAIAGLDATTAAEVAKRRASPRDDLIGALVAAADEDDRLSEAEIVNNVRLFLVAGNATTTDLIANGAVTLLRHPDALADLRDDPALWPAAVDELLRYEAPVAFWMRQAVDDREIGVCPVEAGQTITVMLASANRDGALHRDPDRFDIQRRDQKHFSFGGGQHHCLGASLVRLEAQAALRALFARFPRLRLDPDRALERKRHPMFLGYERVWVRAD